MAPKALLIAVLIIGCSRLAIPRRLKQKVTSFVVKQQANPFAALDEAPVADDSSTTSSSSSSGVAAPEKIKKKKKPPKGAGFLDEQADGDEHETTSIASSGLVGSVANSSEALETIHSASPSGDGSKDPVPLRPQLPDNMVKDATAKKSNKKKKPLKSTGVVDEEANGEKHDDISVASSGSIGSAANSPKTIETIHSDSPSGDGSTAPVPLPLQLPDNMVKDSTAPKKSKKKKKSTSSGLSDEKANGDKHDTMSVASSGSVGSVANSPKTTETIHSASPSGHGSNAQVRLRLADNVVKDLEAPYKSLRPQLPVNMVKALTEKVQMIKDLAKSVQLTLLELGIWQYRFGRERYPNADQVLQTLATTFVGIITKSGKEEPYLIDGSAKMTKNDLVEYLQSWSLPAELVAKSPDQYFARYHPLAMTFPQFVEVSIGKHDLFARTFFDRARSPQTEPIPEAADTDAQLKVKQSLQEFARAFTKISES